MPKIFVDGKRVLVSREDYIFLVGYNWTLDNMGYVRASVKISGGTQHMHRMIAERARINCSDDIDHINGNLLDNRRENLRSATRSQNTANSKIRRGSKSGLKGAKQQPSGRWQSCITVNYQAVYLGTFDSKEEAHKAYCEAAEHYFGEFANSGE